MRFSGVCFHIFYRNSAGLSNVVPYNRVIVTAGFVIARYHLASYTDILNLIMCSSPHGEERMTNLRMSA